MSKQPKLYIDRYGNRRWYLNGVLHRIDGPACELIEGGKYWYLSGRLHREDGPAVELVGGNKGWYLNGELHRIDGAALEYRDGTQYWHLKGIRYSHSEWFSLLTLEQQYNYLWNLDT
jgi:hypothetical protein